MSDKEVLKNKEIEVEVSKEDKDIIYMGESNAHMPYMCEYIVCKGSNDDPIEMNGVAHLIEHYLIQNGQYYNFSNGIKIHGFTSFYYTCYYWYVSTHEEAIDSFCEFEEIISSIKEEKIYKEGIFNVTKKGVIDEINFFTEKNSRLSKLLSVLIGDDEKISLPIGNVEHFKNIDRNACIEYLNLNYTASHIYKYIINRKNEVLFLIDLELEQFINEIAINPRCMQLNKKHGDLIIKLERFHHNLDDGSAKIIFKNNFNESLFDIIVGEIFLMQICDYLCKTAKVSDYIRYEKFFLDKKQLFFIVTINKMYPSKYKELISLQELDLFYMLGQFMNMDAFKGILSTIINCFIDYDISSSSEEDIRMDLINYSALAYSSYNLLNEKDKIINKLKDLSYDQFYDHILDKIKSLKEEGIKVIY